MAMKRRHLAARCMPHAWEDRGLCPHQPPCYRAHQYTPDIVDMLLIAFEHAGFVVVSTFTHLVHAGEVDLEAFIAQHQPQAIVYEIAPHTRAIGTCFGTSVSSRR